MEVNCDGSEWNNIPVIIKDTFNNLWKNVNEIEHYIRPLKEKKQGMTLVDRTKYL